MPKKSSLSNHGGARPGAGRKRKNFSANSNGTHSPQRMWIYTPTLDSAKSLTTSARLEQTKKSFFLYENIGLAARAVNGVSKFVGPLVPQAKTRDEEWNRLAEQAFEDACGNSPFGCDVAKSVNFYEAQELLVKQMALAGDCFWQKQTSNSDRAMFRIIPGENVGSAYADQQDGWIDGVRLSKLGAPVRYRVLKSPTNYTEYQDISADDIMRVGRIDRAGQVRSRPWLHRAADHLQDISEILNYEKMSSKLGASLAFVIKSPSAGQIGLGSSLQKVSTGTGTITKDLMTEGSVIPHLQPGEEIESFNNTHPSSNLDTFLTYLRRDIAHGFDMPASILFDPEQAGGATMRYAMEDAAKTIQRIQNIIVTSFAEPFWRFWIFQEIQAGRLPFPKDDGAFLRRVEFIAPQKVSVDIGRDGRLYSDMLLRGQLSPQRFYAMQGLDYDKGVDDTIRAAIRRKKRVLEIAAEEGVEISVAEVFPPAPGSPVAVPVEIPPQDASV